LESSTSSLGALLAPFLATRSTGLVARRWLITGGSRGIGAAVARAAIGAGDRVALVARGDAVAKLATELGGAAAGAHAIQADLAPRGAADAVVRDAAARLGGLDIVVNNAAMHRGGRIETLTDEDFESVVEADLVVPFRICRAAAAQLPPGGAIVNIGAVVGLRGFPGDAPYGAAKAGLAGLTLVLAIELARRSVTVNLVVPGFTQTEMTDAIDARARTRIVERIPLGRPAEAAEIADVVRWVASAPYMTGAIVPVDGGLMAALGGR
jgi:NAD(P)-dependent dehydrogenase (short-subunit alcohol dehydrogenase family)